MSDYEEMLAVFKAGFRARFDAPGLLRPEGDEAIRAGIRAVVDAKEAEMEELREATIRVMASLDGAISLLERGGKAAKKAAPSDKMFAQMLDDYSLALDAVRDLLNALEAKP